jgi:small-conductance mechanosensitive channel
VVRLVRRAVDLMAVFGVGGIAIALAAQKTLENVIGGISAQQVPAS